MANVYTQLKTSLKTYLEDSTGFNWAAPDPDILTFSGWINIYKAYSEPETKFILANRKKTTIYLELHVRKYGSTLEALDNDLLLLIPTITDTLNAIKKYGLPDFRALASLNFDDFSKDVFSLGTGLSTVDDRAFEGRLRVNCTLEIKA